MPRGGSDKKARIEAAAVKAADDETLRHTEAVTQGVLCSRDLFFYRSWPLLDPRSRAELGSISHALRAQVYDCFEAITSPQSGFTAHELKSILSKSHDIRGLTLLNVGVDSVALTAILQHLTSLTIRQTQAPHAGVWGGLEFSVPLAARLQMIDLSGCVSLSSIDALRSCVKLRCLRMPGCDSVSDLSPLSACSGTLEELNISCCSGLSSIGALRSCLGLEHLQAAWLGVTDLSPLGACSKLEELFLSSSYYVTSLAPRKACLRLCKLNLRLFNCPSVLRSEVADLQQSCTQLAHPSSYELEGLVHELRDLQPIIFAEVLFTAEQIASKLKELGARVAADYGDKRPVIMPILKGGFVTAADLVRSIHPVPDGLEVEFVAASSYGAGTETTGTVQISFAEAVVKGRHCLLVDDLADSGLTLFEVTKAVLAAGAASAKSLVLLDKKERRKVDITPDYIGFDCPNKWVIGNGMDTAQIYRSLPYIGVMTKEAQSRYLASIKK
ncbi:hypothetical protein FOA52_014788 [Chlamydomonas sp. UWO 241]|nr:hypothetical protein FOA52_014788 [Chlamydomonas sp. UWO 241]